MAARTALSKTGLAVGVTSMGLQTSKRLAEWRLRGLFALLLAQPLAGCLLATDKVNPVLDIPAAYDAGPKSPRAAQAKLPPLDWWRAFRSRELTEIIEQARESNLDIAAAIARIIQADAQARVTGAALLPAIT